MGATIVQKILSEASGQKVEPGDRVWADVDLAVIRDFGGPNVILRYQEEFGDVKVFDPDKIAITFDLHVPAKDERVARNQQICREFAKQQGITKLFDVNSGIGQHVLLENGLVSPGDVIVGTDSHMNLLGSVTAFATGVGATDIVAAWRYGKLWFRVPETWNITISGSLEEPTSAKDVILHILKTVRCEGAIYKAIEFTGGLSESMKLHERITLASMVTEMSGKIGFVAPNSHVERFLRERTGREVRRISADADGEYERTLEFDVSGLEPQIACPHSPDNVKPVSEVEGTPIDEVFIGSCTNGRFEDLEVAARILKGRRTKDGVRLIVLPATMEVARRALEAGLYSIFLEAGAVLPNPSCGLCTTGHHGILAPGEVAISTSNRNFPGKVGKGAEVYLASPATAAASAITGEITDPRRV